MITILLISTTSLVFQNTNAEPEQWFRMSAPLIKDQEGNKIDSIICKKPISIRSQIVNDSSQEQNFLHIVKINNEDGVTVLIGLESLTAPPHRILGPGILWMPEGYGSFLIEIFVWSNLELPEPLAPKQSAYFTVKFDHEYYLEQYKQVNEQLQQLKKETWDLEEQVASLKAEDAAGNEEKIKQLLEQIDQNEKKWQSLWPKLDEIQEKSQTLFKVDPATKKKLDDAERVLYDMYLNKTSPTYVGDNPVQSIMASYECKNLEISFDPDETINNPAGDKSKAIIEDMKKVVGDIPLDVKYFKMELI
jgi:hypothetical protein